MARAAGKIVIITGGASGLGAADARLLVEEGASVVITDVNEADGASLADRLGDRAVFMAHDVRDENQWARVLEETLQRFGRLDVLVNNAGVVVPGTVEHTSLEDWQFVNDVCNTGTFLGCKHAIPAMRDSGGGSIINISSIAPMGGFPQFFAYVAAKGAVRGMTKAIAVHCHRKGYGIRCNSVHPGGIATPMLADSVGGFSAAPEEDARRATPPTGQPEDIAHLVLYLASDESLFLNGSELVADGATLLLTDV